MSERKTNPRKKNSSIAPIKSPVPSAKRNFTIQPPQEKESGAKTACPKRTRNAPTNPRTKRPVKHFFFDSDKERHGDKGEDHDDPLEDPLELEMMERLKESIKKRREKCA
jgi:hypothetical protein